MQYRILNRQTLEYKAGGYVESFKIDDDYIVNNNSTVNIVKPKSTIASENVEVKRIVTIGDRNYYCYATDATAYWGLIHFTDSEGDWINILLISTNPKAVEYYTDKDDTHFYASPLNRKFVVNDITYYYSDNQYSMPYGSEVTNNLYRLAEFESAEDMFNSNMRSVAPRPTDIEYLSNVVAGDIIALIQDSGAYHKGVITAVDPAALTISYRSDKELFNDNIPNPMAAEFVTDSNEEEVEIAGAFGVEKVITILETYFTDKYIKDEYLDPFSMLPLVFEANGDVVDKDGNPRMLWTWKEDSINVVDWLTDLFEKYNLVLSWQIDFDITKERLSQRNPRYIVTLSAITNSGGIIKDNVAMQDITYTERGIPDATVCYVVDSESKEVIMESEGNLLNPATMKPSTRLDGSNNTISGNNEAEYVLTDYIRITANKTKDKSDWQTYVLSFWHPYDNRRRWIWCYDKDKNTIAGMPYRIVDELDDKSNPQCKIIVQKEAQDDREDRDFGTADDSGLYADEAGPVSFAFDALTLINRRTSINSKYAKKVNDVVQLALQKVKDADGNERLETVEEAEARLARLVKYIRICLPDKDYNIQEFEQQVQLETDKVTDYKPFNIPAIYYLYDKNGEYVISKDKDNAEEGIRVLPAKRVIASYNTSDEGSGDTTPEEAARAKLIPSKFNQAIEIDINANSKMFDFQYAQFGDQYKIINSNGTINSVFTGKKQNSGSKQVTLLFGLGRQNYTDIITIRDRRQRYTELYNQRS